MASKQPIVLKREQRPFGQPNFKNYIKMKKMVAFLCPMNIHNGHFEHERQACEAAGHDPYFTTKNVRHERESTETRTLDDGTEELVVTGTEVYYVKERTPNWEQVADDISIDSKQLVGRRLQQGWLFPEDLGYAPFCDYYACSFQNPKYRTPVGTFHHRDEAALLMLVKGGREDTTDTGIAVFVDDTTSGDRRRAQLDEAAAKLGIRD